MEIFTDELILRTVTESDIDEIVRMWNYPNEETLENAYQALEYMEQTHKKKSSQSYLSFMSGYISQERSEKNYWMVWVRRRSRRWKDGFILLYR